MKQFAVIGLGNFGFYLATELYNKGHQVLAIDKNAGRIQEAKDTVSQAVVADATDIKALEALGIAEMDAVIIGIGGTVISNSILATLNVKDLGAKEIHAKAISEAHRRILQKIGATEILFPERDLAATVAERLHNPNMLNYLPFGEDYSITQIAPPDAFIGKSLRELDLRRTYGLQVVAIRESLPERMNVVPDADFKIKDSDTLILLGANKDLEKLREK